MWINVSYVSSTLTSPHGRTVPYIRPAGELAFLFQHRGQLVNLGQELYTFPLEDLTDLGNWDELRGVEVKDC